MEKPAVVVDNVSMKFNLSKEKVDSLKDYVIKFLKKEIKYNEFWALQNVDFEVKKGDRVGILGLNGAGKSTLLKVIAGVFKPTGRQGGPKRTVWSLFWNWEPVLIRSIQDVRIFFCMVRCSDIPRSFWNRNLMRSLSFLN